MNNPAIPIEELLLQVVIWYYGEDENSPAKFRSNAVVNARFEMTNPEEKLNNLEIESPDDKRLEREKKLDNLLEGVNRENIHGEIDSGPPVGKEVW